MEDEENKVSIAPVLEEVPNSLDTVVSTTSVELLISQEGFDQALKKVFILESFFNITTKNCEFKDFIREILMTVLRVVECEAGSILEVDHASQSLFFRSVVGRSSDQVVNFTIPFGQGVAGHVAESKAIMVVENVPENKVHLKSIEKAVGFDTRNLVAIPLIIRGKVYGVVELLNRMKQDTFSIADLDTLKYLSQMAAKAIEIRLAIAWSKNHSNHGKSATDEAA